MPPKQSKVDVAKKQKVVEDKTFGLKNKNKSKNVQKFVKSLEQSALPKPDPSKLAAKKKKDEEKAREKELNDLFKIVVVQPKVPVGDESLSLNCNKSLQLGFLVQSSGLQNCSNHGSDYIWKRNTCTTLKSLQVAERAKRS